MARQPDVPSAMEVVRQAFRTLGEHLGLFVALVAVPAVPFGVLIVTLAVIAPDTQRADDGIQLVLNVGNVLLVLPLANGAVAYALSELREGRQPSVGHVYGVVLPLLTPLVATILLAGVATVGGLLLFIVPGLILLVLLVFSAQVVVIERQYLLAALARSARLARAEWRRVALVGAVVVLLSVLAEGVLSLLVLPFTAGLDDHDLRVLSAALTVPAELLVLPFGAIALTLLFLDLRDRVPRA